MTTNLSLPTSVVYVIHLTVPSVYVLCEHPVVDTRVGALDATLETSKTQISTLELQVASICAEVAAKVVQVDKLEGDVTIVQEETSPMLRTIHGHGP